METTTAVPEVVAAAEGGARDDLPQYSLRTILGVWAAAAVPMAILGWVVAPWASHHIGGRDPFIDSLLICFNVGLVWMLVLVLGMVRREQGSLAWPVVRDALWLRAPRDPRSKRRCGDDHGPSCRRRGWAGKSGLPGGRRGRNGRRHGGKDARSAGVPLIHYRERQHRRNLPSAYAKPAPGDSGGSAALSRRKHSWQAGGTGCGSGQGKAEL